MSVYTLAILDGADLSQLSAKKVRKQLEEEHDEDFSDRCDTIAFFRIILEHG